MIKVSVLTRAALLFMLLSVSTTAQTPTTDLETCHDDLDHLRRLASDASEAADDAKFKKDDFANCKEYPETYDLMHDHCAEAQDEYMTSLNDLEDKMDDFDHGLRSTQDSCQYQFTINRLDSSEVAQRRLEKSKERLCASYHKLFGLGMSPQAALQLCKANTDEQWCRMCLGMK